MSRFADRIASQRAYLLVEMTTFNEEQNIRRQFGPDLFSKLWRELELQWPGPTQFHAEHGVCRSGTGATLKIEYRPLAATIHCECNGESGEIVFQVNKQPVPSVVMVFNGIPYIAKELASVLVAVIDKYP